MSRTQRHHRRNRHNKDRDNDRKIRRKLDSPCNRPPTTPTNLWAEFKKHPGRRRHNRWRMRIRWDEVTTDSSGFTIRVRDYNVEIEYTANGVDWFLDDRLKVPAKRRDDDDSFAGSGSESSGDPEGPAKIHKLIKGIHAKLAYRYRVRAQTKDCPSDWSDWYVAGSPTNGPPAPSDVAIRRRPHGILLDWDDEVEMPDDPGLPTDVGAVAPIDVEFEVFKEDVDHYVAQLFLGADEDYEFPSWVEFTADATSNELTATGHGMADGTTLYVRGADVPDPLKSARRRYYVVDSSTDTFKLATSMGGSAIDLDEDGSGHFLAGLYHWKRHLKKSQVRFHVDSADIDEDQKFYGRVLSVDDDRDKSAYIPATQGGNDDPEAAPDGKVPKMIRHNPTLNILGTWSVGLVGPPNVFEDDYTIRRVIGTADVAPTGDTTVVDVLVNTGSGYDSIFEDDAGDMLVYNAGDEQASTKAIHNRAVSRGDRFKVEVEEINGTAPADGVVKLICDRVG